MNLITDSKQVNLCSSSATIKNGTMNSVMLFKLGGLLKKDKHILYNVISVVHAEIPISYYLINNNNRTLVVSSITYTLNVGNYNASTFITMVLSKLPIGYTLALNSITGLFTMGFSSSFTINSTSTCGKFFGFVSGVAYNSTANLIIMPYPCNFLGINRIKIKSMVLKTGNIDTNSGGHSDLLVTIPVNNASGGLITYVNTTGLSTIFPNTDVDNIDITICDENDVVIDFLNIDVFITLQIDSIKEKIENETSLIDLLQQ